MYLDVDDDATCKICAWNNKNVVSIGSGYAFSFVLLKAVSILFYFCLANVVGKYEEEEKTRDMKERGVPGD